MEKSLKNTHQTLFGSETRSSFRRSETRSTLIAVHSHSILLSLTCSLSPQYLNCAEAASTSLWRKSIMKTKTLNQWYSSRYLPGEHFVLSALYLTLHGIKLPFAAIHCCDECYFLCMLSFDSNEDHVCGEFLAISRCKYCIYTFLLCVLYTNICVRGRASDRISENMQSTRSGLETSALEVLLYARRDKKY